MLNRESVKLIFFGTPGFSVPALQNLIKSEYDIRAVITAPDKPAGREKIIQLSPIKKLAMEYKLNILQPEKLRKNETLFENISALAPDIGVIAAYGKIIPKEILEIPKHGLINIHPSLLPKYRGPSPIQSAILNGEEETGITIIMVDEEMDHGSVLSSIVCDLSTSAKFPETYKELAELGARLLIETIPKYINGQIKPQEQDHSKATFTKILKREDSRINWNEPAEKIYNQIRALNPEPGTWTIWNKKIINIISAELTSFDDNNSLGTIKYVDNKIAAKTSKCYLIIKSLQLEGGKEMDAKNFSNGHPGFLNSILG